MINLIPEYLSIVKAILKKHIPNERVWIFGSRITNTVKPFSDIDLVIVNKSPIPLQTIISLEEDFSESTLPYKVDLLEWSSVDDTFKKIISQGYEVIQ